MFLKRILTSEPDEIPIGIFRVHGVTQWFRIVIALVLFVIPFFLIAPLFSHGILGIVVFSLFIAMAIFYSVRSFVCWYYTLFAVTNQRIVLVIQEKLFDQQITEMHLENIQQAACRIRGIFSMVFQMGTITVRAHAHTIPIEFRYLHHPDQIVTLINRCRGFLDTEKEITTLHEH